MNYQTKTELERTADIINMLTAHIAKLQRYLLFMSLCLLVSGIISAMAVLK